MLAGLLSIAVLLRVILLMVPPSLSDDIYRYRWDGKVQASGYNPYLEPPAAASLAPLRDSHWEHINYPRIRTIYPPLAELLFLATYTVSPSLLSFQIAAVVGDLIAIALLLACLVRWQLPLWRVALYALNPLVAVEFASSGHFDAWSIAAVLVAVYASLVGRPLLSTLALGAGVLLKTWPLVLLPLFLRRRGLPHVFLLASLFVGSYALFVDAGSELLQPWMEYAGRWLFNDAGLAVLRWVTGSLAAAKALAIAAGTGLLIYLWQRDVDPLRGGYWLLIAAVLLLPAIHPWYLLWPLPLAAAAMDIGWLLLCGLAPLAYWILVNAGGDSNQWMEPAWVRFALYLPAAIIWLWATLSNRTPASPPSDG